MAQFNVTTTGINITIEDLDLTLTHPQTIDLYQDGLGSSDIADSLDLQNALNEGLLEATDENGITISEISTTSIGTKLSSLNVFMQVNNTDVTTNLNQSIENFVFTAPIAGVFSVGSNLTFFTKTTNGIQVNFTGSVLVMSNIDMFGTGQRTNVQSRLKLDNNLFGSVGASGYIRNSSSHQESSVHSMGIVNVTTGQEITVGLKREAGNGTVIFNDIGTSNLIVIRLN